MLVRLAIETRSLHPRADADRLALMGVTCAAEYRQFLARVYGFEVAVELAVTSVVDLDPRVARPRERAGRARQDLIALGMSPADVDVIPRCAVPRLASPSEALGWMFVVERLTLLSGLIHRHLARSLPHEMTDAAAYLTAYGDTPGAMFRDLGELIGEHVRGGVARPASVVAAAGAAFQLQSKWARRNLLSQPFGEPERLERRASGA